MSVCPLCNGFASASILCPKCQSHVSDQGKVTDYLDDYSSYLDIDMLKMVDGDPKSLENHECLHYFYCTSCHHEEVKAVSELALDEEKAANIKYNEFMNK